MRYLILILTLFVSTSFAQRLDNMYELHGETVDTIFFRPSIALERGFEFDKVKYIKNVGLATGLNLVHGLIDYGAYPYRTRTLQRIVQTTVDLIFVGLAKLITGSWSASLMYLEKRWCGESDEFYYMLHGLDGNSKYGNDFNPVAEHLNFTPIGLIRGGVNKSEHYINLSLSIPMSFTTEWFCQKFGL